MQQLLGADILGSYHMQKRTIVLWQMFLPLNRSSVELLPLLLSDSGFFSSQACRGFLLPCAILIRTALASSSWPLTSNHPGDSGITLQHSKTNYFLEGGILSGNATFNLSGSSNLTIVSLGSCFTRLTDSYCNCVCSPNGPCQVQQYTPSIHLELLY